MTGKSLPHFSIHQGIVLWVSIGRGNHEVSPVPPYLIWYFLGVIVLFGVLSYILPLMARHDNPTPDRCWKGGIFYVNRDDPALFVEKRSGTGYTLNFGNPWSLVVLALIVLLTVAPVVLALLSVRAHLRPR